MNHLNKTSVIIRSEGSRRERFKLVCYCLNRVQNISNIYLETHTGMNVKNKYQKLFCKRRVHFRQCTGNK